MWYADVRDKMTIQPHDTRCDIYKESARRFIPCVWQTDRQTDKQINRRAGRQADRRAGRQAGRQRDRQTDRQTQVSHCPLEEKVFSIREQPIDFACWLGSLAQSVERQHIKLRAVGSSPAGVHFFFLFLSITHMMPQ